MKRKLIITLLCTICFALIICFVTDLIYIHKLEKAIEVRDSLIHEIL